MTLVLALLVGLAGTDPPCPGGTVLDRAALDGGLVAVHDALRGVLSVDLVSLDGFDAEPSVASPAPVRIVLDGAPVASAAALEPLGLGPLPVAVGEIRRVVVCPGPGLAAGRWGGPWIEIATARPARLYAAGAYGNETGDPGPELYTDEGLTNVDRWGPYGEVVLGTRRGRAEAWAAARTHELFPSDPALSPRLAQTRSLDLPLLQAGRVGAAAASAPGIRGRFGVSAARGFPFLAGIQREAPVDRSVAQAAASAAGSLGGLSVRGHLHVARVALGPTDGSRLRLGQDGETETAGPDWTERRLDAAAQARRGPLTVGVQGETVRAEAPGLDGVHLTTGRAWAQAARASQRGRAALAVQASASGGALRLGGVATGTRRLGRGTATATLALDAEPQAPMRPGVWLRRGYTGLDGTAVTPSALPGGGTRAARARLDVGVPLARALRLDVALAAQRSRLDVERVRVEASESGPAGTVAWVPAEGSALRARVEARWAVGRWHLGAGARAHRVVGDADFEAAWARLPALQASAHATVRPDDRLRLRAGLRVRSATRWDGAAAPAVPAAALLDLGVSKRAWGDRLVLSVLGRNVLDAPERSHASGGVHAARLFVRAALTL